VLTGASCHLRRLCLPGPRSLAKAWVTAIRHVAAREHYRLAGRQTLSIPAQRYLLTCATRP